MARKLTRILDKLVQVGPSYLDQTLRSYATENKEYRLYSDFDSDLHASESDANTFAVFSFFSSGIYKTEEPRVVDILLVGGGGGGTIGNISGGSGAGGVVEIRNALIPAGTYNITIGAGGAGGTIADTTILSGGTLTALDGDGNNIAQGFPGSNTIFETNSGTKQLIAVGGGVGGFRKTDTMPKPGGSGGGAGGADASGDGDSNFSVSASSIEDTTVTTAIANGYERYTAGDLIFQQYEHMQVFDDASVLSNMNQVFHYGNDGGDSDAFGTSGTATYCAGGGGGAGQQGEKGSDERGGNGGDGISVSWVNEIFKKVYKFNGDIFWAAGGGGSAPADKDPGNGGKGGGGGGAAYRVTGTTPNELYNNGKKGELGYNEGYNAINLKGGAGGQNTGSGAGGSCIIGSSTGNPYTYADTNALLQGNNGGSGFAIIRVHTTDILPPP